MIFIAFTMIFIISFPTLASAMSGYDSNLESFIPVQGGLVPFRNFTFVYLEIHEKGRILNLTSRATSLSTFVPKSGGDYGKTKTIFFYTKYLLFQWQADVCLDDPILPLALDWDYVALQTKDYCSEAPGSEKCNFHKNMGSEMKGIMSCNATFPITLFWQLTV